MQPGNTRVLPLGPQAIDEAARLIAAGWPVAVPTETVYGLAADATSGAAVARIYEAKGRPSFNPLIVHVPDLDAARRIAHFDPMAERLAAAHWPGPLTLVLPLREEAGIASLVTAGLSTVALRVPAHPAMRALLEAAGRPLAAPSANASGRISPTRAEHVLASLGGRIALVLDGGPTALGLESTIVAVNGEGLRLLRPGPIDLGLAPTTPGRIEAPGQLASHYAPAKPVRLDATDTPEFDHWRWVDFWYPVEHVVTFKRGVYARALRHLAPLAEGVGASLRQMPAAAQQAWLPGSSAGHDRPRRRPNGSRGRRSSG